MPQQPPPPPPRPPRWRNRVAGWLRGVAQSLDPDPFGLDLSEAPDVWADHVRAAARRATPEPETGTRGLPTLRADRRWRRLISAVSRFGTETARALLPPGDTTVSPRETASGAARAGTGVGPGPGSWTVRARPVRPDAISRTASLVEPALAGEADGQDAGPARPGPAAAGAAPRDSRRREPPGEPLVRPRRQPPVRHDPRAGVAPRPQSIRESARTPVEAAWALSPGQTGTGARVRPRNQPVGPRSGQALPRPGSDAVDARTPRPPAGSADAERALATPTADGQSPRRPAALRLPPMPPAAPSPRTAPAAPRQPYGSSGAYAIPLKASLPPSTTLPPYVPADAVAASELWPELPARQPPPVPAASPASVLIRELRLDAEQGAT